MRVPEARSSPSLRAMALAVATIWNIAGATIWTSTAYGQTPFDARNPLAQLAKCALGEEEVRSAIVRDVPSQFSNIPGEVINTPQNSVTGGAPTPALWFGDTVSIAPTNRNGLCSGVHVGGDAVLTAGHCICDFDLAKLPAKVKFQLRDDEQPMDTDPKRTVMLDPEACKRSIQPGHDLAILFINKMFAKKPELLNYGARPAIPADGNPMVPSRTILAIENTTRATIPPRFTPAIIASREALFSGRHDRMLVVGYGIDETGRAGLKRQACVTVLSGMCGGEGDAHRFGCAPGSELVLADSAQHADTCNGDSGGAVYTVVRDQGLYYYHLAAITSRGFAGSRCGAGGIYTLITPSIVAWMRRHGVPIASYPYPGQ